MNMYSENFLFENKHANMKIIAMQLPSGATDMFIELVDTIYLIIKMNNTKLETRYIKKSIKQRESFNLLKEGLE